MFIAYKYRLIILCLIAFIVTWLVFKPILKIAKTKNIVDCPDQRKLQKSPIPILGGVAVFFGIIVALSFYKTMISYTSLFPVLSAMGIMLYLGLIDDILSTKPSTRFLLEIVVALLIIYGLKAYIGNFHGLWGINLINRELGIVLSIITFIGIVNSINMIDGIDGLSSAFSILILGCLGIVCFIGRCYSFSVLSAVMIGALIPFFLHNVFGYTTKMFIGDAGTMMVGTAISSMVFIILSKRFPLTELYPALDFNLIALCLAVLSIPIGDTIRVMFMRMLNHKSPFKPDKTHLHHFFIAAGVSYIWTTILEIAMNILVILVFFLVWHLGASDAVQLYTVILLTLAMDIGSCKILSDIAQEKSSITGPASKLAARSHVERKGFWLRIQKIIDKED